jgi:hypothetical protein
MSQPPSFWRHEACGTCKISADSYAVKAALMFYVAFAVWDEPLMTIGDAVASFLDREDATTKDMCLSRVRDSKSLGRNQVGPRLWTDRQYRWKDVTSKRRRFLTVCM